MSGLRGWWMHSPSGWGLSWVSSIYFLLYPLPIFALGYQLQIIHGCFGVLLSVDSEHVGTYSESTGSSTISEQKKTPEIFKQSVWHHSVKIYCRLSELLSCIIRAWLNDAQQNQQKWRRNVRVWYTASNTHRHRNGIRLQRTSGDNALDKGTPSTIWVLLQKFSNMFPLKLCQSKPIRGG